MHSRHRARKASCSWLFFDRLDYPTDDPPEWHEWVTLKLDAGTVVTGDLALDYAGDLAANYERHNLYESETWHAQRAT